MKNMCWLPVCLIAVLPVSVLAAEPAVRAPAEKPLIQIAILLDTSGSMDGLIDQARTQLWSIVNTMATTKRDGQVPLLQVALYEYGNDGIAAPEGHVRMILPLTDDLDAISEKLFALRTNGGEEYCGWVIRSAVAGLAWSKNAGDYKAIFIAGNEPFTQGKVDYKTSCSSAIAKGIMINTIHCGDEKTGVSTGWRDGAKLADGTFMCIDQNRAVVAIAAPQDEEIAKLSADLNGTYLAYGARGREQMDRQAAQDSNAASRLESGAAVERAVAKSGAMYKNGSWDLVDATKDGDVKLAEMKEEELPEAMRKMTVDERKAYVEEQAKKRGELQQKIQTLNGEREKFVAEKRKLEAGRPDSFDSAMLTAVREQLETKNYEIAK